ncbi:hypothetical protein JMN12_10335 [Capnocytophaga genosp. AHN8471]|uniref:hypothetical protein n=1 Tax=Capnocytophaga genosp. AHN8471 TaxID=327574 RepID=UPI001933D311|nr:hypothetical protein [Capnocytophaga genosp. AHN8471]MBM0656938.1 hypothetical protein [Capnocytophaga genosp. AHN8471]
MRIKLNVFLFCAFFFFYAKGDSQENLSCNFYNKTESLGIGLVKVEKQFITIKNPKLNKNVNEYIYSPKYIVPIFFKPDYNNIFYIVCLDDQKEYYKVLSATGEIYFVSKTQTKFISWEKFLRNTIGISNLNWRINPLHNEPFEKSKIIRIKDINTIYNVIKVKKDWIKIQNENNTNEKGWIQWKKGNNLLIEVYLLM